jgi:hypothetical protein
MIVNVVFTLVFNTCLFPDACRAWQVRPAAQKTWINFKVHFSEAHREFCLTNQTAHQSGCHSANMMIQNHPYKGTANAIAQLTVASDHDTVVTLTTTNAKLILKLETSQTYVKKLKKDIAHLKLNIKPEWTMTPIVCHMGSRFTTNTQAQVAIIPSADTIKRQPRATQWSE